MDDPIRQRAFRMLIAMLFFISLQTFSTALHAQSPSAALQSQATAELQRRGLDEGEVRARLLERGIDIDNISPEELPAVQAQIEAVIAELEAEKQQAVKETVDKEAKALGGAAAAEIQEKVKDGASVEEAIAEEIVEEVQEQAPPARVYGHQVFRNKSIAVYRAADGIRAPDTYILGTGDELTITIFGRSQADFKFTINDEGYIAPSGLPKIFLKGVALGKAKELIRRRFAQFYVFTPEQFSLSLTTARTVTVNIFGEVMNPGSYTVSAINTAFNALVAAGGPSDLGSVRSIRLVSNGAINELDVYDFLTDPTAQFSAYLEDGDLIQVPAIGKVVEIKGTINRPMRYELVQGETLIDLINYAGGTKANTYLEKAQIIRYTGTDRELLDIDLTKVLNSSATVTLDNGDVVSLREINTVNKQTVQIDGPLQYPGEYSLQQYRRLSDLVRGAGLLPEARTDIAFVTRAQPDGTIRLLEINLAEALAAPGDEADLRLEQQDKVIIYTQSRFTDKGIIEVAGAVRAPVEFPFDPTGSITVARAIELAGGLKENASNIAYLMRTRPQNPNFKDYIAVDAKAAVQNPDGSENLKLRADDELFIYATDALSDSYEVSIAGAVRNPGAFKLGDGLTVKDLIILANGFQEYAANNRVEVYRVEYDRDSPTRIVSVTLTVDENFELVGNADFELKPYDQVIVRSVPDFELQQFVQINGEVLYPGSYALMSDNEPLTSIIKRAGGLTNEAFIDGATLLRTQGKTGYIVSDLSKAFQMPKSEYNFILKQGDVITVPKQENLVSLNTNNTRAQEVYAQELLNNGYFYVAHKAGKSARWYVKNIAGGFADNADRKKVSVKLPNGQIKSTRSFLFFKNYPKVTPGSEIRIGYKPPKVKKDKTKKESTFDWDKALAQILAVASVVATMSIAFR